MPQFGQALSLQERLKFSEGSKLATARDDRNVSKLWKKARNDSRQQYAAVDSLNKLNREVAKMRRRIVGGFQPQEIDMVFPFKIYNVQNVTATPAQKVLFTAANLNIDNLTFQIRSGIVGARSYLNPPEAGTPGLNSGEDFGAYGNFEQAVFCNNTLDSDPDNSGSLFFPEQPNSGICTVLDNKNKTLIWGIPSGSPLGTLPVISNQIALNPDMAGDPAVPDTQNWSAAFWLEIVDDAKNGLYANLWGQMYALQVADPTGRSQTVFPSGSNIIPIGTAAYTFVIISEVLGVVTNQYLTGNLINRFPPTLGNNRGRWNEIFAGNANLVFYPGDVVVDDSTPVAFAGTNIFRVWQMVAANPIFPAVGASPAAGNWAIVGMVDS